MASRDILLQPVSAGDLIDRALRLYRRNFTSLLAIAAVPGLAAVVGGLLTVFPQDKIGLQILGNLITWGLKPVVNLMIIGVLTRVVADHLMLGREISFRRTWRLLLSKFGRLSGVAIIGWLFLPISTMIIGGIVVFGAGVVSLLLAPTLGSGGSQWLLAIPLIIIFGFAFLGGGLLFLELYARVVMMPAVSLMEEQPVGTSISRGLWLGAKNSPKVLAVLAFEFCLTYSIALALGLPLGVYATIEGFSWSTEAAAKVSNVLLQIGSMLTAPVPIVAFALLYFDNRVTKEGFDVEILAGDIAAPTPLAPVVSR